MNKKILVSTLAIILVLVGLGYFFFFGGSNKLFKGSLPAPSDVIPNIDLAIGSGTVSEKTIPNYLRFTINFANKYSPEYKNSPFKIARTLFQGPTEKKLSESSVKFNSPFLGFDYPKSAMAKCLGLNMFVTLDPSNVINETTESNNTIGITFALSNNGVLWHPGEPWPTDCPSQNQNTNPLGTNIENK